MILKELTIHVLTSGMSEGGRRYVLDEIAKSRAEDGNCLENMKPGEIYEISCDFYQRYLKGVMQFEHPEQLRILLPFIENLPAYGKFLSHDFIRAAAAILEKTHTEFAIFPNIRGVGPDGKPDFDFEDLRIIR